MPLATEGSICGTGAQNGAPPFNVNSGVRPWLGSVLTVRESYGPDQVMHYNGFPAAEINGGPKEGYSSGQAIQALRETADKVLPAGYGYEFSGLSREEINAGSSTVYIFSLSILFVFLFYRLL